MHVDDSHGSVRITMRHTNAMRTSNHTSASAKGRAGALARNAGARVASHYDMCMILKALYNHLCETAVMAVKHALARWRAFLQYINNDMHVSTIEAVKAVAPLSESAQAPQHRRLAAHWPPPAPLPRRSTRRRTRLQKALAALLAVPENSRS